MPDTELVPEPTIFGRYPAFWTGLIEAILALVLTLHIFNISEDTLGVIMAVVTAAFSFYVAWVTNHDLLAVGVGLAKSVLILATTFGLDIAMDTQTAIITLVTIGLGAFNHTQTSPAPKTRRGFNLAA